MLKISSLTISHAELYRGSGGAYWENPEWMKNVFSTSCVWMHQTWLMENYFCNSFSHSGREWAILILHPNSSVVTYGQQTHKLVFKDLPNQSLIARCHKSERPDSSPGTRTDLKKGNCLPSPAVLAPPTGSWASGRRTAQKPFWAPSPEASYPQFPKLITSEWIHGNCTFVLSKYQSDLCPMAFGMSLACHSCSPGCINICCLLYETQKYVL